MSTITQEQQDKIAEVVNSMQLSRGIGNEKSACSIAAINLALLGKITDQIPRCMSRVIGYWIISTQDKMPYDIRNSREWKELLPLAAGTGRDETKEKQRADIIKDWSWTTLMAKAQPIVYAAASDIKDEWESILSERSHERLKQLRCELQNRREKKLEKAITTGLLELNSAIYILKPMLFYLDKLNPTDISNKCVGFSIKLFPQDDLFNVYPALLTSAIMALDAGLQAKSMTWDHKQSLAFWQSLDLPGLLKQMIEC